MPPTPQAGAQGWAQRLGFAQVPAENPLLGGSGERSVGDGRAGRGGSRWTTGLGGLRAEAGTQGSRKWPGGVVPLGLGPWAGSGQRAREAQGRAEGRPGGRASPCLCLWEVLREPGPPHPVVVQTPVLQGDSVEQGAGQGLPVRAPSASTLVRPLLTRRAAASQGDPPAVVGRPLSPPY